MELWNEVEPKGSNIWIIGREVYDTVCVCVCNRTQTDALVEVDFRESTNVVPLCRNPLVRHVARCEVASACTTVCVVLHPAEDHRPMIPIFKAVAAKLDGSRISIDDEANRAVHDSMHQSRDVELWLNQRTVKR